MLFKLCLRFYRQGACYFQIGGKKAQNGPVGEL